MSEYELSINKVIKPAKKINKDIKKTIILIKYLKTQETFLGQKKIER